MRIRKGDRMLCKENVDNMLGMPLFKKGEVYEVLYVDNERAEVMVCLNHILYANEYNSWPLEWLRKKFKKV